jgi:hypothetical protein
MIAIQLEGNDKNYVSINQLAYCPIIWRITLNTYRHISYLNKEERENNYCWRREKEEDGSHSLSGARGECGMP